MPLVRWDFSSCVVLSQLGCKINSLVPAATRQKQDVSMRVRTLASCFLCKVFRCKQICTDCPMMNVDLWRSCARIKGVRTCVTLQSRVSSSKQCQTAGLDWPYWLAYIRLGANINKMVALVSMLEPSACGFFFSANLWFASAYFSANQSRRIIPDGNFVLIFANWNSEKFANLGGAKFWDFKIIFFSEKENFEM